MATAVDCGADRLRDIRGECCDLCGDVCHPDAEVRLDLGITMLVQ